MDRGEKRKVAKGATLYSKKSKGGKKSTTRSKNNVDPKPFQIRQMKDPKNETKLIEYLGRVGIEVSSYKTKYLLRRIKVRMGRLKLDAYRDYMDHIYADPSEIKELQEALSINVTRFFRNRDTFEELRDTILPQLAEQIKKQGRRDFRIWSAGCAVGAEPYTIGIICAESVLNHVDIKITATDVKNELLSIARNGTYDEPYLAELTNRERDKYFNKNQDDYYVVSPSVKRLITFNQHDLMKDNYPMNLDLILCRNVLIYVDREAQKQIIDKFFDSLRPNGILVLGRTETLFGDWRSKVEIVSTKHRIYRKKPVGSGSYIKKSTPMKKAMERQVIKNRTPISQSHHDRLQELKNFRSVFDERRRSWEEKLDKRIQNTRAQNQMTLERISEIRPADKTTSRKVEMRKLQPIVKTRAVNTRKPLGRSSIDSRVDEPEGGKLTSYRNKLKKFNKQPKISRVRMDLREPRRNTTAQLDHTLAPDVLYKKLKERQKRNQLSR